MAIRDKIKANAAPHLEPGETIQVAFAAQTTSQYFALVSYWIIILSNAYRVVVVTDKRILLCKSGRITSTPIKEVLQEFPRATRLGPASGLWYKTTALGDQLYIHKRFHKDIAEADSLAGLS